MFSRIFIEVLWFIYVLSLLSLVYQSLDGISNTISALAGVEMGGEEHQAEVCIQ